jgi:hypothetical protein
MMGVLKFYEETTISVDISWDEIRTYADYCDDEFISNWQFDEYIREVLLKDSPWTLHRTEVVSEGDYTIIVHLRKPYRL